MLATDFLVTSYGMPSGSTSGFTLRYRDVEDLLAERGLTVSNESIRRWVLKFGPIIARNLRENRPKPYTRWHLDEMVVSIAGRQMYMWRAVDSEGSRNSRSAPTRQGRGIAAAPQTPSSPGFRSDGYRHRQAEILRGGASRNWLLGFARARTARQQPRGEPASADDPLEFVGQFRPGSLAA